MKVKVGEKCLTCKYWGAYTDSCSYCLLAKKSRLRDKDGNRSDPKYCDKYEKGKPKYDRLMWAREGRVRLDEGRSGNEEHTNV